MRMQAYPDPRSPAWGRKSLLYMRDTVTPYDSDCFRLHLAEALSGCGVPDANQITPHSMRIGCASTLYALGYPLYLVERHLGWKCEHHLPSGLHYTRPPLGEVLSMQRELFVDRGPDVVYLPIPGSRHARAILSAGQLEGESDED